MIKEDVETKAITKLSDILLGPKRLPEEGYEAYRVRVRNEGKLTKMHLKGTLVHDSREDGPYKKPVFEE